MAGQIIKGIKSYTGVVDTCWNKSDLVIGNYTSIGTNLRVYLGGNHNSNFISTFPFYNDPGFEIDKYFDSKGDVIIGSDVWIGEYVTIMSGVHIGDGVVIGAKSVVGKDLPSYSVVAGNPAEVRRYRFSKEVIERLLRLAWWNWPEERVNRYSKVLCSPVSEETLKTLEEAT